jgi:hypothetical protein
MGVVVATVPERYALSLRFWDFWLSKVRSDEGEGGEEVVRNAMETLISVRFMQTVMQKLDLEVAGAFRDYALAHSLGLALEDHAELVKWVMSAGAGASLRAVP